MINMSSHHPSDSRVFASYPMPAKIDLIREQPRRESLLEEQLQERIILSSPTDLDVESYTSSGLLHATSASSGSKMYGEVRKEPQLMVTNQQNQSKLHVNSSYQPQYSPNQPNPGIKSDRSAQVAADLARKEQRLMEDIYTMHQRPFSPYLVPDKIDLSAEQLKTQRQTEQAPSPRPNSRASSTRCTSADLLDKQAKLKREIEEMGRKPYNPQTLVLEREQWFDKGGNLTESKRRVKDFCSMPTHLYGGDSHIHEDVRSGTEGVTNASIHTAIIRTPKREIDNKSPLPFAFDNFTTKGVRGNIASVGAIEPERPPAPIYPIIKKNN